MFNGQLTCQVCMPGFTLQGGKCVACQAGQGCAACDPLAPTTCLMCGIGQKMGTDGKCSSSLKPPPSTSFGSALSLLALIGLLLVT